MKKMKKKYIVFIVAVICILLIFFISNILLKNEEKFEWQAKYIWLKSEDVQMSEFVEGIKEEDINFKKKNTEQNDTTTEDNKEDKKKLSAFNNTWTCFRKNIYIENEKDIKDIVARIAVDSKYWLYINDELVVREGQLKRGQKAVSMYYDEINLDSYLKEGNNTIAILVWYFGKDSYSHSDSGQGALLFQTQIGNQLIISDETWKVMKNPAYLKDKAISNTRLSEGNIYYDANLAIEDWYLSSYDDSAWENAKIYGNAGEQPWGELIARDIPQFKNAEVKEYDNFEQYREYIPEKDELLELELPYNMQLTTYLKVEAKAGMKIIVTTYDNYAEERKEQKCTYITKDGVQEFESLAWVNGEKIYYYIPAGVKIISLGYRETGYDTEFSGSFVSDDKFFNELWTMARRTLYINMRDSYMDCPDRERAQWWGDASVAMEQALYCLDENANYLYEKGVKSLVGWKYENILLTIVPSVNLHLPVQMLLGIPSMYNYYEYTGNTEFIEYIYPHLKDYLNIWTIKENGLIHCNNYYALWPWGDSAGNCDYVAIENACYYYALSTVYDMAKVLKYEQDAVELKGKLNTIYMGYNEEVWKEDGYRADNEDRFDVRANAIAVLSGLASKDKQDKIEKILVEDMDNSTFMEKYVLEALCKIGNIEEVQERIRLRYDDMVEAKDEYSSTLWEYWEPNIGSKNHTWSGGPLVIMSKYFAGIKPLKPGYSEISIKPDFGSLKNIESEVNTPKGKINLKARRVEKEIKLEVEVPTTTLIAIEKQSSNPNIEVNGKTICKNGTIKSSFIAKYDSEDEKYIYFYINKGQYIFESK